MHKDLRGLQSTTEIDDDLLSFTYVAAENESTILDNHVNTSARMASATALRTAGQSTRTIRTRELAETKRITFLTQRHHHHLQNDCDSANLWEVSVANDTPGQLFPTPDYIGERARVIRFPLLWGNQNNAAPSPVDPYQFRNRRFLILNPFL